MRCAISVTLGEGHNKVKKPVEHETDAKGRTVFREVFAKWGVNESEEDYGWDFAVEVFRNRLG
jgi:hypothetical protein